MLLPIVIIIFCIQTSSIWTQHPPHKLPWNSWPERLMYGHLINMTAELIKDTTYKLRHAEKIKDMHSHSITFELGSIAAGIQERFQRMLQIYKKYANLEDFVKATYTIPELMNAYHVIQGDYNEIRLERGIFYDIVRKHETTQSTSRHRIPAHLLKLSTTPRHPRLRAEERKQMKWSLKADTYY